MLSRAFDDRKRVYISCSNWEVCGDDRHGRVQIVTDTLHTVYAAGEPVSGTQLADGSFGLVYRRWSLEL